MTFDLLSGLRRGELAGLRWQDVNFDDQTITICQTSSANIYAHVIASAESKAAQTFDRFNDIVPPEAEEPAKKIKKIL